MKPVWVELKALPVCSEFGWAKKPCSTREWHPILEGDDHHWTDTACFFCHKFINQRLSMDMQVYALKELPPPDPMEPENPTLLRTWKYPDHRSILLNRFYGACADYAIRWHRHFTKLSWNDQLNAVGARPHEGYDSMERV